MVFAMKSSLTRERIAVPSTVVLTPRVLAGIILKLQTDEIARITEASIDELDRRSGDPDFEDEYG